MRNLKSRRESTLSKACLLSTLAAAGMLAIAPAASAQYKAATGIDAYTFDEYWTSQLHDYGTAETWSIGVGGSYSGVSSKITSLSGTASQVGSSIERDLIANNWPEIPPDPPIKNATEPLFLGTTAELKDGTSASGTTVNMAWRNRTDIEVDNRGYPGIFFQRPPMAYDSYGMASDIVNLTGMEGAYVLQMQYSESSLIFDNASKTEEIYAQGGFLYLAWFEDAANAGGGNVATREWVNAVDGNSTTGASAVERYQGSYDDYLNDVGQPDAGDLGLTLGSWGVDTTDNVVWAVLDHNSEFGAVPEPGTFVAMLVSGYLLIRRRKREPN